MRSRRDEALLSRVDRGSESPERARAEEREIPRLTEDDLVDRLERSSAQDRIARRERDRLPFRYDEGQVLLDHGACACARTRKNERRVYFNRLMMCQPNGLAVASHGDTPISPTFSRKPTSPKPFTHSVRPALVTG